MSYRFNDGLFRLLPKLPESDTRTIFRASFQAWADVSCGGRKPFFVEQFAGTTATSRAEFLYDVPNESVVAARTADEWKDLKDHDTNALALTLLWHDKVTGEIFDVDMELNTGAGQFADCDKDKGNVCVNAQPGRPALIDLQNTITHEAGHLLGLGHSPVPDSTMEATTASNPETKKRSLEDDDKAGYCSLELPEWKCSGAACQCPTPPIIESHTTVRSCGCRTLGVQAEGMPAPVATGLAAYVGAVALRRWRRRPKQRRLD